MGPGELAGIIAGGFVLLLGATYAINSLNTSYISAPELGIDTANKAEYDGSSIAEMYGGSQKGGRYEIPCSLPGFEFFNTFILPQGLVLSSTIFGYYLWFLINTGRPQIIPFISIAVIMIGHILSLWFSGCITGNIYKIFSLRVFLAIGFGASMGGIGYAIVNKAFPDKKPFSSFSEQFTTFSAKKEEEQKTPAKKMVVDVFGPPPAATATSSESCTVSGNGKCLPPSDEDQFVCEAYRNGELVTSTIVG